MRFCLLGISALATRVLSAEEPEVDLSVQLEGDLDVCFITAQFEESFTPWPIMSTDHIMGSLSTW